MQFLLKVRSDIQGTVQKPSAELYKYKAIKIIESGMLVIHSETQELFFVKVSLAMWNIYAGFMSLHFQVKHKTCKYSSDYLVLPDNVPYMIKLHNYYDCENAVFLILQYSWYVLNILISLNSFILNYLTNMWYIPISTVIFINSLHVF